MVTPVSRYAFYFDLLDQGVKAWNAWRAENPNETINLDGMKLSYRGLKEINLSGVILDNAIVTHVDFRYADFTDSSLRFANILHCKVDYATFTRVKSSCTIIKDSPLDFAVDAEDLQREALSHRQRSSLTYA